MTRDWKIVEVGCGNGFLLKALHEDGYQNIKGYELSTDALRHAHPTIREFIRQKPFSPNREHSVDLIASFHLLDHLNDPLQFLKACRQGLAPGGYVLVACHNAHALSARILGERSPIWDVSHSVLFTSGTLATILKKAGFESPTVAPYVNRYSVNYWLSQLPIGTSILPFFPRWLGKLPLSLPAGNICAVARKSKSES